MKKYIVFAFDHYYPEGGLDDVVGDFNKLSNALELAEEKRKEEDGDSFSSCTAYVVDRDTWEVVK